MTPRIAEVEGSEQLGYRSAHIDVVELPLDDGDDPIAVGLDHVRLVDTGDLHVRAREVVATPIEVGDRRGPRSGRLIALGGEGNPFLHDDDRATAVQSVGPDPFECLGDEVLEHPLTTVEALQGGLEPDRRGVEPLGNRRGASRGRPRRERRRRGGPLRLAAAHRREGESNGEREQFSHLASSSPLGRPQPTVRFPR